MLQKRYQLTLVGALAAFAGLAGWRVATAAPQAVSAQSKAAPNSQEADDGDNYVIKTTSRLVLLDVSVKDSKGRLVSGLAKDDFHVYEDGKLQKVTQFADVDIPVTIGLVVDESGSMRPKRPEVITAALSFIKASNPHDEMFVINFNDKVREGLPDVELFSDNEQELRTALFKGDPVGRTALYDAMVAGLKRLELGRRDKKTLVVISDGGDNVSKATKREVENMVLGSVATIYTIGIFDQDDPDRNPEVLKHMASISGGEVYFPDNLHDIVPVCLKIAKDIRTRYTVGYIPPADSRKIRHIKVSVSAPNHGKLIARTRTSYRYGDDSQDADRKK